MSSSGLQRRRVGTQSSTFGDESGRESNGRTTPTTASTPAAAGVQHGGSAFAGGSKIAYDPRDLEREDEDARAGGKAPRLTLMEEVLLLGLKDQQVCVLLSRPRL